MIVGKLNICPIVLSELLGPVPLNGFAANQTVIPFMGWIPAEFKLTASASLLVPVLVSSDPNVAEDPIIDFNVIEVSQSQSVSKHTCHMSHLQSAPQ